MSTKRGKMMLAASVLLIVCALTLCLYIVRFSHTAAQPKATAPTIRPLPAGPAPNELDKSLHTLFEKDVMPLAAQTAFQLPIINDLPDVSNLEQTFEAKASLQPLREKKIKTVEYEFETVTSQQLVTAEGKVMIQDVPSMTQHGRKSVEYDYPNEGETNIHLTEQISLNGQDTSTMTNKRTRLVDGRYVDEPKNFIKEHFRELDGELPSSTVKKNATWTQRIAVDPELNSGGEIQSMWKVESTFVRNGDRFARIRHSYDFITFRPPQPQEKGDKFLMPMRIDELEDFNLRTGVVEEKSTVQRTYFKTHGLPNLPVAGVIVETKGHEQMVRASSW